MGKSGSNKAVLLLVLVLSAAPAKAQDFNSSLRELEGAWVQLIGGIRVQTAQTAASGNQIATAALKSAEANASALARVDVRHGVNEAVSKYLVGRDQTSAACAPVELRKMAHAASDRNSQISSLIAEADQDFMANGGDAAQVQATLNRRRAEFYCSQEEFDAGLCSSLAGVGYNTGPNAGDTNAAVFMNGGATGAEEVATGLDYIDRVAPLPTVVPKTGAASAISRIIALRNGAEKSMAREIIGGSMMEGLEMKGIRIWAASAAMVCLGAGPALAATCAGVDVRVNARTSAVEQSILALIQSRQNTMQATELRQRQQILSALGVAAKQTATSGNQDAAVRLKSEEAQAQAIVAAQNRQAALDTQERYGDAGFNACAVVERSQAVATAYATEEQRMDEIQEQIVNKPYSSQDGEATAAWFDLTSDGEGTSSSVIFTPGSTDADIARYIDWLMGPPQSSQGNSAGAVSNARRLQQDALRSVSQHLLIKSAVSNEEGSVDAAIGELSATWTGTDGGADWAAKLATSPLRAVLLDMSRAEAANLVAEIRALDHQLDLELGLASFSLARSTKMVEAMTNVEQP